MNRIPKCKTKTIVIPQQPHYLKVNKKEINNDKAIPHKIVQKKLRLNSNVRQFGKDITIALNNSKKVEDKNLTTNSINANNVNNIYNILIYLFYRLKYI
jgi:uncharacterized membrane protein YcaP (DUF421 family)